MSHKLIIFNGIVKKRIIFHIVKLTNDIVIHIIIAHQKFSTQTQGTIYAAKLIINQVIISFIKMFILVD